MEKTERIVFLASRDEAKIIDRLAAHYARNRSQAIREAIREAATQIGAWPIPASQGQQLKIEASNGK
jgi:uncharacterized protein (DUF1778 family)